MRSEQGDTIDACFGAVGTLWERLSGVVGWVCGEWGTIGCGKWATIACVFG